MNLKANKQKLKADITTKCGKRSAATPKSGMKRKSKKAYFIEKIKEEKRGRRDRVLKFQLFCGDRGK